MNQINQTRTKEQIEYDKGLKNLHELSLKKALSEEGIDTSKISRGTFDDIKRLLHKQQLTRQKYQEIIIKMQTEAQTAINQTQKDLQLEVTEIQKEVEEIIKEIKIEQGIITPIDVSADAVKHEEKPEEKQPEVPSGHPEQSDSAGDGKEPSSE